MPTVPRRIIIYMYVYISWTFWPPGSPVLRTNIKLACTSGWPMLRRKGKATCSQLAHLGGPVLCANVKLAGLQAKTQLGKLELEVAS